MRSMMHALVWPLLSMMAFAGCPGAQTKDGGPRTGQVDVVLRRIDVEKAGLDGMDLKVIVAIQNGSSNDLDVQIDGSVALVGEDTEQDDERDGGEDGNDVDSNDGNNDGSDDGAKTPTVGLDGARHAGAGRGKALANAVTEVPLFVRLPLPEDPAALEEILGWTRASVHVAGTVRFGLEQRTIGGERDVAPPKLPQFKVKNAQVAKVDGGAAGEAFITLLLENPNPFAIVVDNVSWRVLIADKELRTKEDGGTSIPASSVEEYNISIVLDDTAFPGKNELKSLMKKPSISYRVDASFTARGLRGSGVFSGDMRFP